MSTDFRALDNSVRSLVESLADRLPPDELAHIRSFNQAGEWTWAVEVMCAVLLADQIAISREQRDALASLLDTFGPQNEEDFPRINHKASTVASLNVED